MNNFSFMDWVSMAEQLNPYITRHSAKRGMQWCKAHCHWSSVFSGVTNHVLSGNPNDESGFGGSQENGTCVTALYVKCKVWCGVVLHKLGLPPLFQ